MTNLLMPSVEVTAPPVAPAPFGLFTGVPPRPSASQGWQAGVWWRSVACANAGITYDPCTVEATVDPLAANVACGIATGASFTVYARSDESMGGLPVAERVAAARDLLLAGEQNAVESALWALMLTETAVADGSAVGAREAFAMAEALIRDSYGGTPVIHAPVFAASLGVADGALHIDGARLRSALNSDAVAGAGYGTPPTATGSAFDVIASGAVVLVRGEILTFDEARNTQTNSIDAMAMRTYAVGWDCTAVRVNVPATP